MEQICNGPDNVITTVTADKKNKIMTSYSALTWCHTLNYQRLVTYAPGKIRGRIG